MARVDSQDFKGGLGGCVTVNYRSRKEIIDAFLTFAARMLNIRGSEFQLDSDRGPGGVRPEYRSVNTADEKVAAVADAIEEMLTAGYQYRDQAILSSGSDRLGRFAKGLERLGIPVIYLGNRFERDKIKDLLSLLSIVFDRRAMGLVRVETMERFSVPLADVAAVLSHLKENDIETLQWPRAIDGLAMLSASGRAELSRIAQLLEGFRLAENPWSALATILLDRRRIAAEIAAAPDIHLRSYGVAIWQLMNFVRTQSQGRGLPTGPLVKIFST